MGDTLHMSSSSKNREAQLVVTSSKAPSGGSLVASSPKSFTQKAVNNVESLYNHGTERGFASQITIFLLKVAALELTRRFSKAKCPFVWRGLQGLQVLCYPPFKWIQRLAPFKGLVLGIQKFSRPLLFLSIATTVSEQLDHYNDNLDATNGSPPYSEPPGERPAQDTRPCDEAPQNLASENWILRLHKELEKQNITLPDRIDEDELNRFYAAANGDFSYFLSSIKKTIRWRETYKILLAEELEMWSPLVFWHGCDIKLRPCLIIRLGLACSSLPSHERPRFAQAIVSQIEHGVLYLLNMEDPQIAVLMDCEGLTPLKFPMQMMRSFSALFQDHYPNRLCCLFIIRLPPVVRVLTQTFIQVLKPATRQKVRIEGEMYKKVLSEFLQAIPAFLGGNCTCPRCSSHALCDSRTLRAEEADMMETTGDFPIYGDLCSGGSLNDAGEYDQKAGWSSSASPPARVNIDLDTLEIKLGELVGELIEINTNSEKLQRAYNELLEYKLVMQKACTFFKSAQRSAATQQRESDRHQIGGGSIDSPLLLEQDFSTDQSKQVKLGYVSGLVSREKSMALERILFRATRGNVFLKQVVVDERVTDPLSGEKVEKNVFVVFFSGEEQGPKF